MNFKNLMKTFFSQSCFVTRTISWLTISPQIMLVTHNGEKYFRQYLSSTIAKHKKIIKRNDSIFLHFYSTQKCKTKQICRLNSVVRAYNLSTQNQTQSKRQKASFSKNKHVTIIVKIKFLWRLEEAKKREEENKRQNNNCHTTLSKYMQKNRKLSNFFPTFMTTVAIFFFNFQPAVSACPLFDNTKEDVTIQSWFYYKAISTNPQDNNCHAKLSNYKQKIENLSADRIRMLIIWQNKWRRQNHPNKSWFHFYEAISTNPQEAKSNSC